MLHAFDFLQGLRNLSWSFEILEIDMRTQTTGSCKSSPNIRSGSGVLGRWSLLLADPENPHANIEEYAEVRYVLPFGGVGESAQPCRLRRL
jgi:hypothetical protein